MAEGGVWRTVGGRRVFIKDGQSLSDAMKESGKFSSAKAAGAGHISVEKQKEIFGDKWEENDELIGDFTGDQRMFSKDEDLANQLNAIIEDYPEAHWGEGALYRGVGLDDATFAQLKKGAVFSQRADSEAPSSWSSSESIAEKFTKWDASRPNKVILVENYTPIKNAISIKANSGVPDENEVIYSGRQNMIVQKTESKNGITYVYVKEHGGKA